MLSIKNPELRLCLQNFCEVVHNTVAAFLSMKMAEQAPNAVFYSTNQSSILKKQRWAKGSKSAVL